MAIRFATFAILACSIVTGCKPTDPAPDRTGAEVGSSGTDAPATKPIVDHRALVEQIRGGDAPGGDDADLVAAVEIVDRLGGSFLFDAAGTLRGFDVKAGSVPATDDDVARLLKLPNLRELRLVDCTVTNRLLQQVACLPELTVLDLRGCASVNAVGLEYLVASPGLRVLKLGGYGVNDAALAVVRRIARLQSFSVEDCGVTNAGLALLVGLPLEELTVFRCLGVNDRGLAVLASFPGLRRLSLRDTPVDGSGLSHLRNKAALVSLNLSQTHIGDDTLSTLRQYTKLERLDIRETTIGDDALDSLRELTGLESLRIDQTGITPAGVESLRAALPDCTITF